MIRPTRHEKLEWARMAQAAYSAGINRIGHRYSGAASIPDDYALTVARFDELQSGYRDWLCFNRFPDA
jgi:hypothetical protein